MLREVSAEIISKINYFMIHQVFNCSFVVFFFFSFKLFITLTESIRDLKGKNESVSQITEHLCA